LPIFWGHRFQNLEHNKATIATFIIQQLLLLNLCRSKGHHIPDVARQQPVTGSNGKEIDGAQNKTYGIQWSVK